MTRFQKVAVATTAATFALVGVGGLVRATDSGEGCPTWPRCFGHWFPPFGVSGTRLEHALIEYSHRFTTFLDVVLIVLVAVMAWSRGRRRRPGVAAGATAALVLILVQAALGAAVVRSGLSPAIVTIHYANAMLLVAAVVFTTVAAFVDLRAYRPAGAHRRFASHVLGVTMATYVLLLVGTYVRGRNAGLVFRDWPLMNGRVIPDLSIPLAAIQFVHRLAALVVFVGVAAMVAVAAKRERDRPAVRTLASLAGGLFLTQVLFGAGLVWTRLGTFFVVAHELTAGLVWGALVALALLAYRLPPRGEITSEPARSPAASTRFRAYLALTKPGIIVLLLITTVPAMILAKDGWPSPWLVAATLIGGTLAAGGANTINCYIDRDIDEVMRRTRRRPLPSHQVDPRGALVLGVVLGVVAFVWLTATVNLLSAALAVSALVFYVFVYTLWMKRSTPQNIVIGGAAGAVPVLVGWAAVTGHVGLPAFVLFGIVFYWTPPHFWALSMRYESDYRAAGVPMMPVVHGVAETTRHILLYSFLLFAVTLLLYPVARLGPLYLTAALALGGWFLWEAFGLRRDASVAKAMHLFHYSNTYLALLFAAVAADPLVRALLH